MNTKSLAVSKFGWVAVAAALLAASCNNAETPTAKSSSSPEQVTEPLLEPVAVGAPKKKMGEPCDKSGAAECASGVCLKTGITSRLGGNICSHACSDAPCEAGYTCAQLYPAPGNDFCVRDTGQRLPADQPLPGDLDAVEGVTP